MSETSVESSIQQEPGPLERPQAPAFFRWLTYILLIPLMLASRAMAGPSGR